MITLDFSQWAAHPDIYAECSKRTTYKRFSMV